MSLITHLYYEKL